MNTIDFNKTGGFPLETETLDKMQSAYNLLQSLGDIVGEKSIIKGCKNVGATVTDGVIYLNGELLEFRGGAAQTKIIIVDEPFSVEFEDGDVKPVFHTRYATFGVGVGSVLWADFVRAFPLTSALFIDEVRMYAGDIAKIPWGWYLADGQNGTMDLRDKFPVPFNPDNTDYNAIGKVGGQNKITPAGSLDNKDISITISRDGWGITGDSLGSANAGRLLVGSSFRESHEVLESIRAAGSDKTVNTSHKHNFTGTEQDNRPAHKVVGFIQFKGI